MDTAFIVLFGYAALGSRSRAVLDNAVEFGVIGAIVIVVALFVALVASMLRTVTGEMVKNIRQSLAFIDGRLNDHEGRLDRLEENA